MDIVRPPSEAGDFEAGDFEAGDFEAGDFEAGQSARLPYQLLEPPSDEKRG
jgi:hypothetical protein